MVGEMRLAVLAPVDFGRREIDIVRKPHRDVEVV